jgi:hypothetical protein
MKKAVFKMAPDGRGIMFTVKGPAEEDIVIISEEFLDDEVGDDSTNDERQTWVEEHLDKIMEAYNAISSGGIVTKPFDRVIVRRGA